jgi:catechol 2,3-dioxygenase-like lactoylglutathione lyase family enzyme
MAFNTQEIIVPPSPALRGVVSHYWLCLNNSSPAYIAVPDGAIDLVFQVDRGAVCSGVYGTTTARVDAAMGVPIEVELRDEPWGDRHFVVVDPNGMVIQLVQWVTPLAQ